MQKTGSAESKLQALQSHAGLASQVKLAHARLYMEDSSVAFCKSTIVTMNWDEANHQGLSLLCGLAVAVKAPAGSDLAAYLRPTVAYSVLFLYVCV